MDVLEALEKYDPISFSPATGGKLSPCNVNLTEQC